MRQTLRRSGHRMLGVLCLATSGACFSGLNPSISPRPHELPVLEQRLSQDPSDFTAALRLGIGYRETGRLDEARSLLEQIHNAYPADGPTSLFLGLTYEDMGLPDNALAVYEGHLAVAASGPLGKEVQNRMGIVRKEILRSTITASLRSEATLAAHAPNPRSVAVFPFSHRGGDSSSSALGRAFSAMLVTDLSQTARLSVLERTDVNFLLQELALVSSGRVDPRSAARTAQLLGAGTIVQGLISQGGGGGGGSPLTIETALLDVSGNDDHPTELSDRGQIADLFEMEKRIAFAIYESLGIELTPQEREKINHRWTENIEALLAFGLGLEAEARQQFTLASQHFTRAFTLDPSFSAAETGAEKSREKADGSINSTEASAERAVSAMTEATGYGSFFNLDDMLSGVETLIPGEERNPVSEAGVFGSRPGLTITIPRPRGP